MELEKKITQIEIVKALNDYALLKEPSILELADLYEISRNTNVAELSPEILLQVFKKWLFTEKSHLMMIYGYLSMPCNKLSIFRNNGDVDFLLAPNDLDKYVSFSYEVTEDCSGGNREYPILKVKITSVTLKLRFEYPEIDIEDCINPDLVTFNIDLTNCKSTKFSYTYKDGHIKEYISK